MNSKGIMKHPRIILGAYLATLLAPVLYAEKTVLFTTDQSQAEIRKIANHVEVVADQTAKGGKAIRVVCQGKGSYAVINQKITGVKLTGRVTVNLRVRGENFVGLAETLSGQAALRRADGKGPMAGVLVQGARVKPDAYGNLPLQFQLPAEPSEYDFSLYVSWDGPDHHPPTAWIEGFAIVGNGNSNPFIVSAVPDRVCYRPTKPIQVEVTVANPTAEAFHGKLRCTELRGLEGREEKKGAGVEVAAGASKAIALDWTAGKEEAGRELQVELLDHAGKTIDTVVEYYGVARDPSALCTMPFYQVEGNPGRRGHGYLYVGPSSISDLRDAINLMRERRVQRWEVFSWSYNELAQFLPPADEEPYLGNQGIWWQSFKKERAIVKLFKDSGITPITYILGQATGPAAYELFQQRPEWCLYNKDGEVQSTYDMEWRAHYEHRHDFDFVQKHLPFFDLYLNPLLPEVRQHIANQLIRVAKEMGFEGGRWDVWNMDAWRGSYDMAGNEIAKSAEEADRLTVESLAAVKALVAREVPDFTWGYNLGAPEENVDKPKTFAEKCRDGGWILDEVVCTYNGKQSPYHFWEAYTERIISWGDHVRQLGGIYNPFGLNRMGGKYPVDRCYESIIRLIAGARGVLTGDFWDNPSGKVGNHGLLAFRYGDCLYGANLRLQPEKQTVIRVEAPDTLWWKKMVFENKSPAGRPQRIVHLVNSPVSTEVEENPESKLRDPVPNVKVSCEPLNGKPPRKAWLLTAEPIIPAEEPAVRAVPLTMAKAVNRMVVTVPSVQLWKIVVFEY